ncbi:MAG: hypothetical protein L0287_24315, partial [Anaerolineae bacterium]|nr:hypothetical protein [Anaerolineae bacterium]
MTKHSEASLVHVPYSFTYADETEREAATGFVPADVGKLARQLDDNSLWMLTDDDPATWVAVGGGGGVSLVSWTESGVKFYGHLVRTDFDPTVPAVAGWTWVNQGSSVAVDLPGGGIS